MNSTNGLKEAHCYYCDKGLDEEKGELAHGCLDCYQTPQVDRIDARDKKIKELKKYKEQAEPIIKSERGRVKYWKEIIAEKDKKIARLETEVFVITDANHSVHIESERLRKEIESLLKQFRIHKDLSRELANRNHDSFLVQQKIIVNYEKLESKFKKAREVIEFYANDNNWYASTYTDILDKIGSSDMSSDIKPEYDRGGKRARQFLKENPEIK